MTVALSVADLAVSYGLAVVLESVSLEVLGGEVVGLLGPNGAGKTTLVKALTGRIKPASGSIAIAGESLRPGRAHRHRLGFAPQSLGLYHQLSGRENLEAFASMSGLGGAQRRQRVAAVLEEVAMTERAHLRVARMSGGMQRRIHVAAALLGDPALLILDEPTVGVDAEARALLHRVMAARAAAGTGVLLITHELAEAERLCQRAAVLVAGRLRAFEPPATLVTRLFARAQVFVLELRDPPGPALSHALTRLELRPTGSPAHWEGIAQQDPEEYMAAIRSAVVAGGGAVRALGVRAPDLALAVARLAELAA